MLLEVKASESLKAFRNKTLMLATQLNHTPFFDARVAAVFKAKRG